MPKTETRTLYLFTELSEEAQEKVIERKRHYSERGNDWADEWRDTLSSANEEFGFKCNWEIGGCSGPTYCDVTEIRENALEDMKGTRLWKFLDKRYGFKECPWTGVYSDEVFLKPFREFMKRPRRELTWKELLQECCTEWARGWLQDIEYQFSDECIREEAENEEDIWYTEQGEGA